MAYFSRLCASESQLNSRITFDNPRRNPRFKLAISHEGGVRIGLTEAAVSVAESFLAVCIFAGEAALPKGDFFCDFKEDFKCGFPLKPAERTD
ncbi:hypothetical protein [Paenibacillus monticola]|uniref:Uncharacterized protein n=1 Tax=Paenibacillus monticola TaxID=2666075 RepID=A0A7X2HBE9_9BACL|nr:hypothetical protein [Paenibacillus monticola]MRN57017.1 hypothetical protein [Paenibacillus monticola]